MTSLYDFVDRVGRTFVTVLSLALLTVGAAKRWPLDEGSIALVTSVYLGGNAVVKATANLGKDNARPAPKKRTTASGG